MGKKYIFNPGHYEIICDATVNCNLEDYLNGDRQNVMILLDIEERIISPFNIDILMEWLRNTSLNDSNDNICAMVYEEEFLIEDLSWKFYANSIDDKYKFIEDLNNIFSTISFKINNILAIVPRHGNPSDYLSFVNSIDFLEIQQCTDNIIGTHLDNKGKRFFKERCSILKGLRNLCNEFEYLYVSENECCFVWNKCCSNKALTEKQLTEELEKKEEQNRANADFWSNYFEHNPE